jgi:hypothetical protein
MAHEGLLGHEKKNYEYKTTALYVSLSAACDFRMLFRPKMRHEKEGELPPNENTDTRHVISASMVLP